MTAADVPNLKLKWAFGFPGGTQAYGNPAIVAGRVFVGSDNGTVYALDAATGCTHWTFKADGGVRTAPSVGLVGRKYAVYIGDLKANLFALDAETGAVHLEEEPRHAPLRAHHRRAGARRRQDLRAGVVDRGSAGGAAELRMLHLPRQRRRARSGDRRAAVEELHDHRSADRRSARTRRAPRSTRRPARRCGTRRPSIGRRACSTSAPATRTPDRR